MSKIYKFDAIIKKVSDIVGAFIEIPFDVNATFAKGCVPVNATFDRVLYSGSLVKMGTHCHIIGIKKDIFKQISKQFGDTISVKS